MAKLYNILNPTQARAWLRTMKFGPHNHVIETVTLPGGRVVNIDAAPDAFIVDLCLKLTKEIIAEREKHKVKEFPKA